MCLSHAIFSLRFSRSDNGAPNESSCSRTVENGCTKLNVERMKPRGREISCLRGPAGDFRRVFFHFSGTGQYRLRPFFFFFSYTDAISCNNTPFSLSVRKRERERKISLFMCLRTTVAATDLLPSVKSFPALMISALTRERDFFSYRHCSSRRWETSRKRDATSRLFKRIPYTYYFYLSQTTRACYFHEISLMFFARRLCCVTRVIPPSNFHVQSKFPLRSKF